MKILKDLGKKIKDPQGSWQEFLRILVKIFIRIFKDLSKDLWRSLKILKRFSPGHVIQTLNIKYIYPTGCNFRSNFSASYPRFQNDKHNVNRHYGYQVHLFSSLQKHILTVQTQGRKILQTQRHPPTQLQRVNINIY